MSNHTIKAKNKKTGEVVIIYVIMDMYNYRKGVRHMSYTEKEFNDLFEVVEDKPFKIRKGGNSVANAMAYILETQTDTLKKEDWEERFDKQFEEIILDQEVRTVVKGIKHFITQEIAKAKEEIVEKIREYRKGTEMEGHLTCDEIINLIK